MIETMERSNSIRPLQIPPPASSAFQVEVSTRSDLFDAAGAGLLKQIRGLGIRMEWIRVSALYELSGPLNAGQAQRLAKNLFCDPVTQTYEVREKLSRRPSPSDPHGHIEVWLRPEVSDPIASSAAKGIGDLGLPIPSGIRCGTLYRFSSKASKQLERIAVEFLFNPVIHQCKIY